MYQANPHSANDKFSALDNVNIPGVPSYNAANKSGFGGNQNQNSQSNFNSGSN